VSIGATLDRITPREQDELVTLIPLMRGVARCLCADPVQADDLVADTLATARLHPETRNADAGVRIRLFSILRDGFRLQRREAPRTTALPIWVVGETEVAAERFSTGPGAGPIGQALRRLPDDLCEAITLVEAARLTDSEASMVCGCTPAMIRSRVRRAHKSLAAMLSPDQVPMKRRIPNDAMARILAEPGRARTEAAA
jgi:RNA polymerase sigma-70 factor (ECF subfamily)